MKEQERDEFRVPSKEVKGTKKEKFQTVDGQCECCHKDGPVVLTDDGDFCEGCMSKMSWLK